MAPARYADRGEHEARGPPEREELAYRLHQQAVVAEFGLHALEAATLDELLDVAVRLSADGMHARFSKAIEFLRDRNTLLLRAGRGWRPGFVGRELLDLDTPAGYVFRTGEPVIADHPADDERFHTPPLLTAHGVRRTVVVPVPLSGGRRWGTLGTDSPEHRRWDQADLEFLTGMARLLGVAIERCEAREFQRTLLQEASHRVKNSLALVSSLLEVQARTVDEEARRALTEASQRVHAVARVHDQLWREAGRGAIDLKPFLSDLCRTLGLSSPKHRTHCDIETAFIGADLAVPLGLVVNELLTNAYKYAYPEGGEGEVRLLGVCAPQGRYRLEVADLGVGLPPDFDPAEPKRNLGMRVVTKLAAQVGGDLTVSSGAGARFVLEFPLENGRSAAAP